MSDPQPRPSVVERDGVRVTRKPLDDDRRHDEIRLAISGDAVTMTVQQAHVTIDHLAWQLPIADGIHHRHEQPSLHDVSRVLAQLSRNHLIGRLAQTGLGERLSSKEVDAVIHVVHVLETDDAHADELTPEQFAEQALAWKARNPQAFDAFIANQARIMGTHVGQ